GIYSPAADGIPDATVTGVQTCALPISPDRHPGREASPIRAGGGGIRARCCYRSSRRPNTGAPRLLAACATSEEPLLDPLLRPPQIGRASCRERLSIAAVRRT